MSDHERRYEFTTHGPPRLGAEWIGLSVRDFREREIRVQSLAGIGSAERTWAWDLLTIARAVFLVDKRFRRDETPDRWTRTIHLSVQVNQPGPWTSSVLARLDTVLGLLTGDQWTVSVRPGSFVQTLLPAEPVGEIALYSGGLDSTAYAAQAAGRDTTPLLLIAFDDGLQARQREIYDEIQGITARAVRMQRLAQTVRRGKENLEQSSRSRGFLYLTAAVCCAAGYGLDLVAIPENGQLAVNPPLTAGRLGALSTRSVHPYTLALVNEIIRAVGGSVHVINPLLDHTKGEVCKLALDAGLPGRVLGRTISCGSQRRNTTKAQLNCGHCYPCLVRRAGLVHTLGDDPSSYIEDLAELPFDGSKTRDLRALAKWLRSPFGLRDVIADSYCPDDVPPPVVLPVLSRGRGELATMLDRILPEGHPLRRGGLPFLRSGEG